MTINLKLIESEPITDEGYPLSVFISHRGKRKQKTVAFARPIHWLGDEQIISVKHPDYDILMPVLADLKIRARKIVLQQFDDVNKAYAELFKVDFSEILFVDFYKKLIAEMNLVAVNLGNAKNLKEKNKLLGNIKVYENVMAQFDAFGSDVTLKNLDHAVLLSFKNYQIGIGNSKSTVSLYLRTLRSIYNKGIALNKLPDQKPFAGLFKGLNVKSYNSKKKYLDESSIRLLEAYDGKNAKQKYVDLFLLQFYFGGCDLIDLYYLTKKQRRRERIIFERTKVSDGARIDLKIHPKAAAILDRYAAVGDYLFPWEKDKEKYEVFRRTYQRGLIYVQQQLGIEVLPDGGNIGVKVARHTFSTRAKRLGIDQDIIRELMGHERNEVDNYYKDKYQEAVRDEALFKIIG